MVLRVNQHVRRLEVPMQDPPLMRVVNGPGDAPHIIGRQPGRQRLLPCPLRQAPAIHEVHREIRLALVLAHFMDGHDVRVLETGRGFGLGTEALHELIAGEPAGKQQLHRDDAIERDLASLEDHAHAAAGDFLDQFIVAEVTEPRAWWFASTRGAGVRDFVRRKRQPAQALRAKPFQGAWRQGCPALLALAGRRHVG
jgi:hypothetical protein